jgi:hypothetical protein
MVSKLITRLAGRVHLAKHSKPKARKNKIKGKGGGRVEWEKLPE